MKLNHECIRDILLYLEENLHYGDYIFISDITLKNYSTEELLYTCERLHDANYLHFNDNWDWKTTHAVAVTAITYQGHQFLNNIRDDDVWNKTQNVLSKFKSTSISFIADVSSQIIANIISKQLGFN